MTKAQLDTLLRQSPPQASFLYGDSFMIEYYSKRIANALNCAEKSVFYFDEYDTNTINALLSQGSLFGTSSLVVLKLHQALSKADITLFLQSLSTNSTNSLIIEYYQSPSKGSGEYISSCKTYAGYFKNPKMPANSVIEVRFFEPNMSEKIALMRQKCASLKLRADDKILAYMLNLQNNDIALSLNELDKFVLVVGDSRAIEAADVNALCDGVASVSIEELCYTIMDKKPFIDMMQSIYEEGVNEVMMIGEIERFFYKLFLFFAFIKIHGSPNAREILGYNPPAHIAERLARYAIRFREGDYINIFELLSYWRFDVSKGNAKQSISALIKIQALIR